MGRQTSSGRHTWSLKEDGNFYWDPRRAFTSSSCHVCKQSTWWLHVHGTSFSFICVLFFTEMTVSSHVCCFGGCRSLMYIKRYVWPSLCSYRSWTERMFGTYIQPSPETWRRFSADLSLLDRNPMQFSQRYSWYVRLQVDFTVVLLQGLSHLRLFTPFSSWSPCLAGPLPGYTQFPSRDLAECWHTCFFYNLRAMWAKSNVFTSIYRMSFNASLYDKKPSLWWEMKRILCLFPVSKHRNLSALWFEEICQIDTPQHF